MRRKKNQEKVYTEKREKDIYQDTKRCEKKKTRGIRRKFCGEFLARKIVQFVVSYHVKKMLAGSLFQLCVCIYNVYISCECRVCTHKHIHTHTRIHTHTHTHTHTNVCLYV
jgi:hypothetical protein